LYYIGDTLNLTFCSNVHSLRNYSERSACSARRRCRQNFVSNCYASEIWHWQRNIRIPHKKEIWEPSLLPHYAIFGWTKVGQIMREDPHRPDWKFMIVFKYESSNQKYLLINTFHIFWLNLTEQWKSLYFVQFI
jgi:hypothetical protein